MSILHNALLWIVGAHRPHLDHAIHSDVRAAVHRSNNMTQVVESSARFADQHSDGVREAAERAIEIFEAAREDTDAATH